MRYNVLRTQFVLAFSSTVELNVLQRDLIRSHCEREHGNVDVVWCFWWCFCFFIYLFSFSLSAALYSECTALRLHVSYSQRLSHSCVERIVFFCIKNDRKQHYTCIWQMYEALIFALNLVIRASYETVLDYLLTTNSASRFVRLYN